MTEIKLPYGLHAGELMHIRDAVSGLACNCTCLGCGEALIAKKGEQIADHFAHKSGAECVTALESALHLAAKAILETSQYIALPEHRVQRWGLGQQMVATTQASYAIEAIQSEQRLGGIVADLVAYIKGEPLVIEIKVTHAVDAAKLAKLQALGLSAIEIDLSAAPRDFQKTDLIPLIVDALDIKKWLHHECASRMWQELLAAGERKVGKLHGPSKLILGCPIEARMWKGRPYANALHDCNGCPHMIFMGDHLRYVICGGKLTGAKPQQPELFG